MRTAIVTGGTRGIGRAIAAALLADGGRVMIAGLHQTGVDRALAELVQPAGDSSRVAGCAADVRERSAVDRLIDETVRRFGAFDTLINNAGVGLFIGVEATSDEGWDRVIGTNLTGAFYCSRAALPHLRKAGGGWIVNIASLAGTAGFANGAAYCASKAGLIAFS